MNRKAEDARTKCLRVRTMCWRELEEGFLAMEGNGVMDECRDFKGSQMFPQAAPFGCGDDKEVIVADSIFRLHGYRKLRERRTVGSGNLPSTLVPAVELSQLHLQDRGMNLVESAVLPRNLRGIILTLSIIAKQSAAFRHRSARRHDHSAVAIGSEIFRRIETESRGSPE